ncbi:MAG: cupin domain-containing protein [Bacteroidota bacterium]
MKDANYWINHLQLLKHPEGGYYKEVYRSEELINQNHLPNRFNGDRCFCTAIYFLLQKNDFSAFHRIKSDETWHFYQGTSLTLYMIDESGVLTSSILGNNPENNESLQITIPQNTWFAAHVNDKSSYTLTGCTVAPGFDFADFELGKRNELINLFPQHKEVITLLSLD